MCDAAQISVVSYLQSKLFLAFFVLFCCLFHYFLIFFWGGGRGQVMSVLFSTCLYSIHRLHIRQVGQEVKVKET